MKQQPDEALHKGAIEDDGRTIGKRDATPSSLAGQQGHRDANDMIKDSDSDFPEPGAREEHSGE